MNPVVTFMPPQPGQGGAAGAAPVITGKPAANGQAAWLREMERAQTATWFKPHVAPSLPVGNAPLPTPRANVLGGDAHPQTSIGPTTPSAVAARHDPAQHTSSQPDRQAPASNPNPPARVVQAVPVNSTARPGALTTSTPLARMATDTTQGGSDARPTPPPVLPAHLAARPVVTLPRAYTPPPGDAMPPQTAGAALPTLPASAPPPDNTAPRLHAQWTATGVNVWLGIGGQPDHIASQAQALVPELRRQLQAQGQLLGRVVCNGRLIFDSSTAGQQPPRVLPFSLTPSHSPQELP